MRIVSCFVLILFTGISFGQRPYSSFKSSPFTFPGTGTARDYVDTVKPVSFIPQNDGGLGCFTGVYSAPDSGYVTGNNKYGDLEKAQFYSLSKMGLGTPATIQSVVVYFGAKAVNTTPENVYVRVYSADTFGLPSNLLAVSNALSLTAIATDGAPTGFTFLNPVNITDSFFLSIVLPQVNGDTIAIVSTLDECKAISGWSWEKWSNSTWHQLVNSWILDVDLAVFPVMNLPDNTGIAITSTDESQKIYPDPASGNAYLEFSIHQKCAVQISIINTEGRVVSTIEKGLMANGDYTEDIDIRDLCPGLYHIVLLSAEGKRIYSLAIN